MSSLIERYPLMKGSPLFENDLVEGVYDFDKVYSSIEKGTPFYVVTGIRAIENEHIGYKFLARTINYFSARGGKPYLFLPHLEDKLTRSKIVQGDIHSTQFYDLLAKEEANFVDDREFNGVFQRLLETCNPRKLKRLPQMFGMDSKNFSETLGLVWSLSSFFYPNYKNKTNYPTLVLGITSHTSLMTASREISEDTNLERPSAIIFKQIPGKDGLPKMSASHPSSNVYIGREDAFMSAITAGKSTLEEQLLAGGNPANCPALRIASFFTTKINIDNFKDNCLEGNSCHSCKKDLLKFISD